MDDLSANINKALSFHQLADYIQAQALYEEILSSQPLHADALHFLGVLHYQTKNPQKAAELISKSIHINPQNAIAHCNLGVVQKELNLLDGALGSYSKAIQLNSRYEEAFYNQGNIYKQIGRPNDALESYSRAIEINPNYADAYNNRGLLFQDLNNLEPAILDLQNAVSINSKVAGFYVNLAHILKSANRYEEALKNYELAFELKEEFDFLVGFILRMKFLLCDWSHVEERLRCLVGKVSNRERVCIPFQLFSLIDDPVLHHEAAKTYSSFHYSDGHNASQLFRNTSNFKIKIGYFSNDYRNHPVAHLIAELFELHDKSRFEVVAFSLGALDNSAIRSRIKKACNAFVDLGNLPPEEAAVVVQNKGIDIAVDLGGFTGSASEIFSLRVSPIQLTYLGYPGTMGSAFIDYLIADPIVIPPGGETFFSEKIVYLPYSYQVNDRKRTISDKNFTRLELGLPEKGFIFCCFNNSFKITPSVFDGWMRILKAVDGSVLWLLNDNSTACANLKKEAASRQVDPLRIIFADRVALADHLARHRVADLFLDTLPYNAHTTASDALWAGLPVLTRIGQSFPSRVAASLLNAIGLPELIVKTQDEYEALAIELATNPSKLREIKQKLEKNRLTTPLFDTPLFTKHIEEAYKMMIERYRSGLPPDQLRINSV